MRLIQSFRTHQTHGMDTIGSTGSADIEGILRAAHGWGVGWGESDAHTVISERSSYPRSTGHSLRGSGFRFWRFGTNYCLRQAKVYFLRHAQADDMIILRINMQFQARMKAYDRQEWLHQHELICVGILRVPSHSCVGRAMFNEVIPCSALCERDFGTTP